MPATKEITIYKWEELSQTAQERARNWYIEGMDYDWWDSVYDMCIEDGYEKGFVIDKINFSGFYSQGDGARWIGQVDVSRWLEVNGPDTIGVSALRALINNSYFQKHIRVNAFNSHYCHENTMDVGEFVCDDERLIDPDDLDWVELNEERMNGQGIFDGMTLADITLLINADEANPYKLTNLAALDEDIETSAKAYATEIYSRLREEYEYLCSEEMMLDHFNANDYHFTNEGELA